jgi:hypothetical protein
MERLNPDFLWVIENPKGYMRKQEIMERFHLHAVSYCRYGLKVQKHTDLFSNMEFNLAPPCDGNKAGHWTHERVLDQPWDKRSVVPSLLAKTIVAQMIQERERREKRKVEMKVIREADLRGEVAEQASYVGERDQICVVEPLETKKTLWPRDYGIPERPEDGEKKEAQPSAEAGERHREDNSSSLSVLSHPGRVKNGEERMGILSGSSNLWSNQGGEEGENLGEGADPVHTPGKGKNVQGLDRREVQETLPSALKKGGAMGRINDVPTDRTPETRRKNAQGLDRREVPGTLLSVLKKGGAMGGINDVLTDRTPEMRDQVQGLNSKEMQRTFPPLSKKGRCDGRERLC